MDEPTGKLKKQLGGSPEASQPENFVIFLDETHHNCQPILNALEQMSIKYERHGSHFRSGALDDEWLPTVGSRKWALLTSDKRIRYNQLERDKLIQYDIREFVFTSGNLNGRMMAEILIKAMDKMKRLFEHHEPPFIAYISQSGNVEIRYDKDGSVHGRKQKKNK
jgi:hypothetical protein